MSVIEQSRELTPQDKIGRGYSYTLGGVDSWFPNPLDFMIKNCCDNCDWFEIHKSRDGAGLCLKDVANDEFGGYIKDSDTFYCSYHKFKV